jgi:hypothetical protein
MGLKAVPQIFILLVFIYVLVVIGLKASCMVGKAHYYFSHTSSSFVFIIYLFIYMAVLGVELIFILFLREGLANFAWADQEFVILLLCFSS